MIIFAHILLIIGIYCTAWGISLPPVEGCTAQYKKDYLRKSGITLGRV